MLLKSPKESNNSVVLSIVLLVIGLDMVGVGILIPILPQLLGDPDSQFYLLSPAHDDSFGLFLLGALIGAYPLAQFIAAPILGRLSDRYGRRPVLLISTLGTGIGYTLFAIGIVTANIGLLFFSRFLDGFTGGNHSVAEAVVADISREETRARNFGYVGASFGLGYIFGPLIGGVLSAGGVQVVWFETPAFFNATTPFWFATVLCTVNFILLFIYLRETSSSSQRHSNLPEVTIDWTASVRNIIKAAYLPGFRRIYVSVFCVWASITVFIVTVPLFLIRYLNTPEVKLGSFFAICALALVASQALLVPLLAKRISDFKMVAYSLAGLAIAFGLVFLFRQSTIIWFVAPLISISAGLVAANQMALISRVAPTERTGEFFGIAASVSAIAEALMALLIGYLSTFSIGAPVLLAIAISLSGAATMLRFRLLAN